MTVRDHEVLDLLRDEPQLLAVADAVATTQRPARGVPRKLLAVPALAVALLALALVAPWQGSAPSFFDRAAAAVGNDAVLHVITEQTEPADFQLVDLATGERSESRPQRTIRVETWYDPDRSLEHSISQVNGKLSDDTLQTPDGVFSREGIVRTCAWIQAHPVEATRDRISCRFDGENGTTPHNVPEPPPIVDPGIAGFLTRYQQALEDGSARIVGEDTLRGRPITWIEMHLQPPRPPGADRDLFPINQRVAVDRETYRPLRVESLDGHTAYDVVQIETVPTDEADFSRPEPASPETLVAGGSVVSSTDIDLGEARSLLGVTALWSGQTIHGLELTKTAHDVLETRYDRSTGIEPRRTDGLHIAYGRGKRSISIYESTGPASIYFWASRGVLWPVPPEGKLRLGPFNWGFLVRNGVYVTILSPLGEGAVIAAARALEPIPPG